MRYLLFEPDRARPVLSGGFDLADLPVLVEQARKLSVEAPDGEARLPGSGRDDQRLNAAPSPCLSAVMCGQGVPSDRFDL
jgi:hypothetical protein